MGDGGTDINKHIIPNADIIIQDTAGKDKRPLSNNAGISDRNILVYYRCKGYLAPKLFKQTLPGLKMFIAYTDHQFIEDPHFEGLQDPGGAAKNGQSFDQLANCLKIIEKSRNGVLLLSGVISNERSQITGTDNRQFFHISLLQ